MKLDSVIQGVSAVVLLIVSSLFGYLSMPKEMGLAILAGALGMAFSNLDKISEFKGAGFSAKMKDQFQAVIDKETEPNVVAELDSAIPEGASKILSALQNTQFTWRSISGLMQDTKLDRSSLSSEMGWLVENDYARHSLGKHGSIWTLTPRGRNLAISLSKSSEGDV